jgi:HAD superfamily hydrolase (TIGR01509 family)
MPTDLPGHLMPVTGVLFDLHSTLVDQGDPRHWLLSGWRHAGRGGTPEDVLGTEEVDRLAAWLDRIWEHAGAIDPDARRDLSPQLHREVYDRLIQQFPAVDAELAHALYETMLSTWTAYRDSAPTLKALAARGVRTALVSNIGIDVRPMLEPWGLDGLLDAVVLSYEVGATKPDPRIFEHALDLLAVAPDQAVMVGDSWHADSGAARLGVRTLLLPRTSGPVHGLDAVLRLLD